MKSQALNLILKLVAMKVFIRRMYRHIRIYVYVNIDIIRHVKLNLYYRNVNTHTASLPPFMPFIYTHCKLSRRAMLEN